MQAYILKYATYSEAYKSKAPCYDQGFPNLQNLVPITADIKSRITVGYLVQGQSEEYSSKWLIWLVCGGPLAMLRPVVCYKLSSIHSVCKCMVCDLLVCLCMCVDGELVEREGWRERKEEGRRKGRRERGKEGGKEERKEGERKGGREGGREGGRKGERKGERNGGRKGGRKGRGRERGREGGRRREGGREGGRGGREGEGRGEGARD